MRTIKAYRCYHHVMIISVSIASYSCSLGNRATDPRQCYVASDCFRNQLEVCVFAPGAQTRGEPGECRTTFPDQVSADLGPTIIPDISIDGDSVFDANREANDATSVDAATKD